jgi:Mg2+ and Co2+ transporter CorA
VFKLSNVELRNREDKILHYVSNDNLMKYLMDDNEITLLVNLYKTEMMILSVPVFKEGAFIFRRLLLVTEEDSGNIFLIYNDDLLIIDSFEKFIFSKRKVKNVKESVYFIVVNAYLDFVNFLKFRFEEIESQVVNEKFVARNIINLMLYDTILQKASPNLEGIGMLVEETSKRFGISDVELANSLISLKVEIVQIKGLVNGLSELSDNISHSIDSINNYRLNRVMRTLTILTVCLAIPTMLAGIYGMNIPLPFQKENWILYGIVVFSMFIILGTVYIFRRKRYF